MTEATSDLSALGRLCDRLRSATAARLTRSDQRLDGASVAGVAHQTAVWAALRQGLSREVPHLHPLASGDQLAVIGRDFLQWATENPVREGDLARWRERVERLRASI